MIRVRDLNKRYTSRSGARHVLRGVSLDVDAGQMVALLGSSGAGKSTLLQILGALDQDFSGEVTVASTSIAGLSDTDLTALRREHIGFMFQDYQLLEHLNVLENVMLPCRFEARLTRQRLQERAVQLLTRVGLESRQQDRPGVLSGGERQRVALARALLRSPTVLLADEPSGNLDVATGNQLMDLLLSTARDDNCSVLVATHDENVARRTDTRLLLVEGQFVVQKSAGDNA